MIELAGTLVKLAEAVETVEAAAEAVSEFPDCLRDAASQAGGLDKFGSETTELPASKSSIFPDCFRQSQEQSPDKADGEGSENGEGKGGREHRETDSLETFAEGGSESLANGIPESCGLTEAEQAQVKAENGWSDRVVKSINSMEECNIYRDADLVEAQVGEKTALIRPDIDWNQTDPFGRTNQERAAAGLSPLDASGKPIELHHIGQHADSPLAELTFEEHRGGGNDTVLHDKSKPTETHGKGNHWDAERQSYWTDRSAMLDGSIHSFEERNGKL